MVIGTDSLGKENEKTNKRVAQNDRDPHLPPTETCLDTSASNLPSVDVVRVGNPEKDKVEPSPSSVLWVEQGLQVVIDQKVLDQGQVWVLQRYFFVNSLPERRLFVHHQGHTLRV